MKVYPFSEGDASATFQNIIEKFTQEIRSLENDYVLKASITELENYYIEKVTINPLILYSEQYYIENQSGTEIDVSRDFNRMIFPGERATVRGTRLDIAIPYEGDSVLWRLRASSFSLSGYPEIDVMDDRIIMSISFPDDSLNPEQLKSEINRRIESLSNAVRNLSNDVARHNSAAQESIKSVLQRKRQLSESTTGAVAALGIPVKRRGQSLTYTAPVKRRVLPISRPKVPTEPYKQEPVLSEEEYQHILEVMRSMSLVIERSPDAFASLDEEAIRVPTSYYS